MIVAYYGLPNDRVFGRVKYSSMESAIIDCYSNSSLWGLHDTDKERTWADRAWDETEVKESRPVADDRPREAVQVSLFE